GRIPPPPSASTEGAADAGEDALALGLEVGRLDRAVELLGQRPLLVAEVGRDDDVDDDALVAAAATAEPRQTDPAQRLLVAWLGPGRDLDLLLAVEGRD